MTELVLPKQYRRNFWCLVADFCFFGVGMAFVSQSTVLPGFMSTLGASSALIGLTFSLQSAGWLLPQLFAARYMADKPFKKPYIIGPAAVGRMFFLMLALLLWLTRGRPSWLVLLFTVVMIVLFFVADGVASVPWFEFFSKVIPPTRRGRLTGTAQALSGVLSFMAGGAVEWMLSARGPSFPLNYVALLLCGFVMLLLSLLAVWLAVEERSEAAARNPTWREYLPKLWAVLKGDRSFRRYMIARQLFGLSGLAAPFYMTYALRKLNLPLQVAGRYTSIGVVGSILAAVVMGWVNERYGSKRAMHISIGLVTAVPLLALVIPHVITHPTWLAWGYGLVFLCHYATMSSIMPSWVTYVLELAPEGERPTYIGLANTLNGLTTVFSTIGGLILQWTNNNYNLLFVITFVGLLLAWPLPFGLPEPRHRQTARL